MGQKTKPANREPQPKAKELTPREKIAIRAKQCEPKGKRKPAMGRPSIYTKEFCPRVIAFMACGFSLAAFAGDIGVSRDTVYEWAESHPDFSDALKKARAARTLYWEKRLHVAGPDARAVIFALRNSCAEEWKNDPDESGVTVNVNNEVNVEQPRSFENMSAVEIEAYLKKNGVAPITSTSPRLNGKTHKPPTG